MFERVYKFNRMIKKMIPVDEPGSLNNGKKMIFRETGHRCHR